MTEKELLEKLDAMEQRLAELEKASRSVGSIGVVTSSLQTQLSGLRRRQEKQMEILVQALRESVPAFGPIYDRIRTDKQKTEPSLSDDDVEGLVWGDDNP